MLTAKPLSVWDARFCWRLANEPSVRAASFDATPPTILGHCKWMMSWLFKSDRQAWVVKDRVMRVLGTAPASMLGEFPLVPVSEPIGLARIQRDGTIGIATTHTQRQRGAGIYGVRIATEYAERHGWGIPTARIKSDNGASIGLFARAGYEMAGARDGTVTMEWRA